MLKPFGAIASLTQQQILDLHDAQGWAIALGRPDVLEARGRIMMLQFCGKNRNYDPAHDWAIVRGFLASLESSADELVA